MTSRQAGDVYEMTGPDFEGRTFKEGLQVIHDKFKDRMNWVWGHDLEADFNEVKERLALGGRKPAVMHLVGNGLVSAQAVSAPDSSPLVLQLSCIKHM